MRNFFLVLCSFVAGSATGQPVTDSALKNILAGNKDSLFQQVLAHPETYRLQIIYTEIDRTRRNQTRLKNYHFHFDPDEYFNPASTVKLPLALLSLEKLNKMKIDGVDKHTAMQFDSSYERQVALYRDSTSQTGLPSIAHFVKKAFLVSDNDAYNRMYQFVGQQDINRSLHSKGYTDVRITREFMGFSAEQNRHTNQVRFIRQDSTLVYTQPAAYNTDSFYFPYIIKIGEAHYDQNDSLVHEPFDFTRANNLSLEDLQRMLQSVLFPSSVPSDQRFRLTEDDRRFVLQFLSQFPSETNYPKYDTGKFYDSNVKFYFKNGSRHLPEGVRVFNKVGWAYGFVTDVSYVADFKNNIEFMLSATLYVNSDGIVNDDKYDYDSVGYPFLYQLGQTIYQYELGRSRKHRPDLSAFKIQYEHRDPADKRPTISEVDN